MKNVVKILFDSLLIKTILAIIVFVLICWLILFLTQKHRFLSHLHNNTPDPYKDCMVEYVDKNYDELMQKYWQEVSQEKIRMPRGRTDTVNYMVATYLPHCQK